MSSSPESVPRAIRAGGFFIYKIVKICYSRYMNEIEVVILRMIGITDAVLVGLHCSQMLERVSLVNFVVSSYE